ncbi:MAG: hypothetical protein M3Y51_00495 [Actinomycetota bacterium]|nr:hypothetical protein [Actinomycetota bacterium]
MRSRRRAARSHRFLVVGVASAALLGAGCSGDDDAAGATSTTAEAPDDTSTIAPSSTVADGADVDQAAPDGANGIKVASDGTLWIASVKSDLVLQVDATSGRILRRVEVPEGSAPDDVALGDDGAVYWTGYLTGDVGRIAKGSDESTVLANVGPGANPVAVRDDGTLIVGRAGTGTGLFTIDPAGDPTPVALGDPGNINSFDLDTDGRLFSPGLDTPSVIEIDADTGETLRTVAPIDGTPIALRWHDGSIYVLVLGDEARVERVDPATGVSEPFGETGLPIADNLAVADDGTVFVTGLTTATVTVLGADGTIERTIAIGG